MSLPQQTPPNRLAKGLTPEGLEWLHRPIAIPVQQTAFFVLAEQLAVGFDITVAEALAAIAAAVSMAVGSGVTVASGHGPALPLSIQLAVVAGINPKFDRCITALCKAVIDTAAEVFGKEDMKNRKTLQVTCLRLNSAVLGAHCSSDRQRMRTVNLSIAGKRRIFRNSGQPTTPSINNIYALLAGHSSFLSSTTSTPLPCASSSMTITTTCSRVIQPDGAALSGLFDSKTPEKYEVSDFLSDGFRGGRINLISSPSWTILPAASAVWLCPPDLIAKGFSERIFAALPGFLVAVPSAPPKN